MSDYVVLDIETTGFDPWRDQLLCVGIGEQVYHGVSGRAMAQLLFTRPVTVVAHTNYDLRWLALSGVKLTENVAFHDTKVMAWMLDGTQELSLEALAIRYLGYAPPKPIKRVGNRVMFHAEGGLMPIEDVPWEELVEYNRSDLATEAALYERLRGELQRRQLWNHFVTEEAPFSRLLVEMEATGTPFDGDAARDKLGRIGQEMEALEEWLVEATGAPDFNLASTDHVGKYLYSDLWEHPVRFPIPRLNGKSHDEKWKAVEAIAPDGVCLSKVGRDYAYGEMTLEGRGLKPPKPPKGRKSSKPTVSGKKLAVMYGDDPWVSQYVKWRKLDKLRGYLEDWIEREHNGRLHGRFDQSGTITGRLSAREPNLQQVAGDSGVRDLFRGDLVIGDYAGLEARLAAHFSRDPVMMDVFREGKDLYGVLAARAWGGPDTKEHPDRALMKVVWLASQYGAQGETLAQTMAEAGMHGYTAHKADALLNDMMKAVPRLFQWREEVIAEARAMGYVTTLGGRPRQLADIASADWYVKARAERQAVNSKVQGSAADVVRRAMLNCRKAVPVEVARICLQVHDEIMWVRGPEWDDDWFDIVKDICENATFALDVPLVFDAKIAGSWAEK